MPNPQGVVQSESVNKTTGHFVHNRSRFANSLSYRKAFTARFGEYTPSFEMEGVPTDSISLNTLDLLDSLSLKAPFKGTIRKIKESFAVPNMAILPRNWDRIYTQPSNGDDVPKDANCVLQYFPSLFAKFYDNLHMAVRDACDALDADSTLQDCIDIVNGIVKTLVLGEYVYSNGSLLHTMGYKSANMYRYKKQLANTGDVENSYNGASYDRWFDAVIQLIFSRVVDFQLIEPVGDSFEVYWIRSISSTGQSGSQDDTLYSSFRFFLEKMRENPACHIGLLNLNSDQTTAGFKAVLTGLTGESGYGYFEASSYWHILPNESTGADPEDPSTMSQGNLNLSRLLAYQLVCAHFYSNSSIDFVYSAELFRQYIHSLFRLQYNTPANAVDRSFEWNGILCPYDELSEHYLARSLYFKLTASDYSNPSGVVAPTLEMITDSENSNYPFFMARFACFAAIFGFRKSLRFGDYFVGSRPRPIAPINTEVAVSTDNTVSVLDLSKKMAATKFGQAVMRSRQKIEEYTKGVFGRAPAPDYHNPFFLSREVDTIFGDEVQNTAESQLSKPNSRTSNFAMNGGRYTFTFKNDDSHPCIYLQIISFDAKRAYTRSVDRQFLALDRYDMFNPNFQYIGDQPVYGVELGYGSQNGLSIPVHFAYQSRDMEFKQRFDVASGGFVENLPGWLLTDRNRELCQVGSLSPDFIRNFNCELDQFYISLTGYSLGSYYHFALITNNNVDASRPMAVDPQILG